ncbi:immunoglobulin lambda-1 light chain-like [Cheilinus undulatus]|uniref:immunoglobulin lambda-1 light chain-like n=1 Tax=Cheilinus undulatus TaxID=241271 RepID=UPI001BD3B800|nr:immunoglobulin lambda-1 light chain-like [Cheilinus undulatus]
MAADLQQPRLSLTRNVGEKVPITCQGFSQCSNNYVFWLQKTDTKTIRVILWINRESGAINKDYYNHPQKNDFTAVSKQNRVDLQIQSVKLSHSASYYCTCWKAAPTGWIYLIFGSGTKLFVSANPVVQPAVSIYPAASRSPLEEKRSLLCVSSAMFPPLVRFFWSRRPKKSGRSENLPSSDGQQLRESGCMASILAVDQRESDSYEYSCSVQHETGEKEKTLAPTEFPTFPEPSTSLPTSPTSSPPSPSPSLSPAPPSPSLPPSPSPSVSVYKLRLLLLLYTLLIVKSLVYCCGLFLMTVLRNKRPSTDCRQAG